MLDGNATIRYPVPIRTSCQPLDSARRSCGRLQRWFVVQSLPGRMFQTELALASDGWRVFHPLHLHRTVRHPPRIVSLFPNYAFVSFDPQASDWPRICRCFGVQALLGLRPGQCPAPVPRGVVEELQRRTSARRVVDDPLSAEAWRRIPLGAAVSVVEGPLAGLVGVTRLSAEGRCRVLLSLFGREVVMDLPTRSLAVA